MNIDNIIQQESELVDEFYEEYLIDNEDHLDLEEYLVRLEDIY